MICSKENLTSGVKYFFRNLSHAAVKCFNGPDCSVKYSRVTDHIGIGKIKYYYIIFVCFNLFYDLAGNLRGAHLRLKVIGGHLRGRNKNPVLKGAWLFCTAVKEKCNMSVFFRFSNAQLVKTQG